MDYRVEQAVERIAELAGDMERARCLVIRLYDDIEITDREIKKFERQMNGPKIFFCEYGQENIQEPFMPFMGVLGDYLGELDGQALEQVFEQCGVYSSHREIFRTYLKTGRAERREDMILDEIGFEQRRMEQALFDLTVWCSRQRPFVLILNSFQRAGGPAMRLVRELMETADRHMVHMVILYDALENAASYLREDWEEWLEAAGRWGQLLEFGSFLKRYQKPVREGIRLSGENMEDVIQRLRNLTGMLDLGQAEHYLDVVNRRLNVENSMIPGEYRMQVLVLYVYVMICQGNYPRALSLCQLFGNIGGEQSERHRNYLSALAYMRSGRMGQARECLGRIRLEEDDTGEMWDFRVRMLQTEIRMGGWNRMNFPLADVAVEAEFLRRAERLGFYNHLAYMRIYGSDNDVEGALRFLDDETALPDFGQALAWAKSVGNEVLVDKAYCRNVMIAANSGRYHVSNRYQLRCFEAMRGTDSLELGRVYNGVGFNYTMMREYQTAGNAYAAALQLYCRLGGAAVREAAGTFYYMGLNALAQERFAAALDYFERSMGIMGRLGIYGQRFCDLSQFYSLMALCSMYERNTTSARVYLSRAGQFLEHVDGCVLPRFGSARASVCGDLFLYHYARGLNAMLGRDYQRALDCMEAAEEQIGAARPDQRICGGLYRRDRLELFVRTGRMEEAEAERRRIRREEERDRRLPAGSGDSLIPTALNLAGTPENETVEAVEREIERMVRSWEKECRYREQRNNRRFVSSWIRILSNVDDIGRRDRLELMVGLFERYFSLDGLLIVRFPAEGAGDVFYSDLDCAVGERERQALCRFFEMRQKGFAISRFTGHFGQYREVTELFDEDRLCSIAGIPFFNNNRLECAVFAVIYMRDSNVDGAGNYVIGEEQLDVFEMLFYQLNSVICRSEKDAELRRVQEELRRAATTDQLTGILNREGFYRRLRGLLAHGGRQMGLLYIDLDNFKSCNDRFGHQVGDAVLREIAGVFEAVCGQSGAVVRFGGDEFVICAPNAKKEELEELARRIYGELERREYFLGTLRRHVSGELIDERDGISCSIGIACGRVASVQDVNRLLLRADNMLYEAKKGTKGIYFVSHE